MNWKFTIMALALTVGLMSCDDDDTVESVSGFTVNTDTQDFDGLVLQIGSASSAEIISEANISGGLATLDLDISQYAGEEMWFCIPKVAKYFHTITTAEAQAKAVVLPDKDEGCTLLTAAGSPQYGDKYTSNDWKIAVYMGIHKQGDENVPIYWATGNLIATKTNAAGTGSTLATFHIASHEETIAEADPSSHFTEITMEGEKADGYQLLSAGQQWDLYSFGDVSGLTSIINNLEEYIRVTGQEISSGEYIFDISGNPEFDAATAGLGTLWRTPTCGKTGYNEFAPLEDSCEEYADLEPDAEEWTVDGEVIGYKYDYTVVIDGKEITTNTLYLPAVGYRHGPNAAGRGKCGFYWSGTADPTKTHPYIHGSTNQSTTNDNTTEVYTTAFNYAFLEGDISWYPHPRTSGQAIRPVCE